MAVSGDHWPIFLYQGYSYDLEDPWNGLLRSNILVSVGPSDYIRSLHADTKYLAGIQTYIHFSQLCRKRAKSHPIRQCANPWYDSSYPCVYCVYCHSSDPSVPCRYHPFTHSLIYVFRFAFLYLRLQSSPGRIR
jgi:hypothetical protein